MNARTVRFHAVGGPEVLRIEDLEVPEPGPDELLLRIEAIGLNRAEAAFRAGRYIEAPTLPARLGYEASGIVEAVGSDAGGFRPGDAVCVLPAFSMNRYGVYAERAVVPASAAVARPPGMDAVTGAAVWMAYLTAYGGLVDVGRIGRGDFVVITAASSSVGLAAIQVCRRQGAIPIALTGSAHKAEALRRLGAEHVVVGSGVWAASEVARITGKRGAHLVFDPVAGPGVAALAEMLAPGGMLLVYGNLSGQGEATPFPFATAVRHGLSVRGYLVFEVIGDPARLARGLAYIADGLADGGLKPVIARTFSLDDIVDAHRYLESNQQVGKVVVTAI